MVGAVARAAPAPDAALDEVKAARATFKADAQKKKFRHHWQNLARRFEQVAQKYPKSPRAAEALYAAGELYRELSAFSQEQGDLEAAEGAYRAVLSKWPEHTIADDAALALGKLSCERRKDCGRARVALAAFDDKGDKRGEIKALLKKMGPAVEKAKPAPEPKPEPKPAVAVARPGRVRESANTIASAFARAGMRPGSASSEVGEAEQRDDTSASAVAAPAAAASDDEQPAVSRRAARAAPTAVRRGEATAEEGEGAEVAESAERVVEPTGPLALESLTERLRDVRVGERPVDETAAKLAVRSMAKQMSKDELTLAEQLGLKVKRVIIDAGHGGHDTGAIGKNGTREKDVTLSIALKLQRLLEAQGLEVLLTRDDDTYVKLEDRTRFANRHKGDLFISVHCNSAPTNTLRGVETYTLNTSSNRYSIRLAARENAATERGVGDLQLILADLATKANTSESTRLAEQVQQSMVTSLKPKNPYLKDLGHKEALFFVLLGAKMPAILVETAFLSHGEEEKLLSSGAYQTSVAEAIAGGVGDFLTERSRLAQLQ